MRTVAATALRHRPLERFEVDIHRDFKPGESLRLERELDVSGAVEGDAFVFEPGEPLRVMRQCDLLAWLRSHGLDQLARRVEHTPVPSGRMVGLILGDEAARVRTVELPAAAPPLPCAALRVLG